MLILYDGFYRESCAPSAVVEAVLDQRGWCSAGGSWLVGLTYLAGELQVVRGSRRRPREGDGDVKLPGTLVKLSKILSSPELPTTPTKTHRGT